MPGLLVSLHVLHACWFALGHLRMPSPQPALSQCRADEYGKNIYPRQFNSLCLVDHNRGGMQVAQCEADVEELITVLCATLDPAQAYCTRVSQNHAPVGFYIVGFGTVGTLGRQLLGMEPVNTSANVSIETSQESLVLAMQVHTQSALCCDTLKNWAWATENNRRVELHETALECAQTANTSTETTQLILRRFDVTMPPSAFCCLPDISSALPEMQSLPLPAWVLILRRHGILPRGLEQYAMHKLPNPRTLRVLQHDFAGHLMLATSCWLPVDFIERPRCESRESEMR